MKPSEKVCDLIRQINAEISGEDDWFVIVVGRNGTDTDGGDVYISGSNIDQAAALRCASDAILAQQSTEAS